MLARQYHEEGGVFNATHYVQDFVDKHRIGVRFRGLAKCDSNPSLAVTDVARAALDLILEKTLYLLYDGTKELLNECSLSYFAVRCIRPADSSFLSMRTPCMAEIRYSWHGHFQRPVSLLTCFMKWK